MESAAFEVAVIIALVLFNGLLAMAEMAIVSSRRARLQELVQRGLRGARTALALSEDPTQFLATVQIGITLVGVVAGAYAGVTLGEELGEALGEVPALALHSEFLGVSLVVALTTYLSLVFGELLPKRLALNFRERIAVRVAPPMWLLQRLMAPVVWLLTASTALILRATRLQGAAEPSVTQEELVHMVREGARDGVLETAERDMIEGVLELDVRSVGAAMTPRHKIVWLDAAASPQESLRAVVETGYTRYPVCEGSSDTIRGVINAKTLLGECWQGKEVDLAALVRPAVFLPETASNLDALEALRDTEVRLLMVVDEYGTVQGLCSLNDVLKTLVGGAITGPHETTPSVTQRADGSYLVDGMLPMRELVEHWAWLADMVDDFPFHTVTGLVMSELGAVPQVGDTFVWQRLHFEVMDIDGHRVDKILVTSRPEPEEPS